VLADACCAYDTVFLPFSGMISIGKEKESLSRLTGRRTGLLISERGWFGGKRM